MNLMVLSILAMALWSSAIILAGIGFTNPSLSILRYAAIPDALAALVFTVLAVRKWNEPKR